MSLRKDQYFLLLAALASAILWLTPLARWLLLPLTLLNTHLHELCHALAGFGTGAIVHRIDVFLDGSGATYTQGGNGVLISSAGYVGTALIGGFIIAMSGSPKGARGMLWTTFGFLALSQVLFLRGDMAGVISLVFWLVALGLLSRYLTNDAVIFAGQFLGMQMCFTSVQAFADLLKVSWISDTHSDAKLMQEATGIPDFFWASAWMLFALGVMFLAIRRAWKVMPKYVDPKPFNKGVFTPRVKPPQG